MAREDPKFMLRMPADLKARVEEAARAVGRSMNAEIVQRLEQSFSSTPADNDREIASRAAQEGALYVMQTLIPIPDNIYMMYGGKAGGK